MFFSKFCQIQHFDFTLTSLFLIFIIEFGQIIGSFNDNIKLKYSEEIFIDHNIEKEIIFNDFVGDYSKDVL